MSCQKVSCQRVVVSIDGDGFPYLRTTEHSPFSDVLRLLNTNYYFNLNYWAIKTKVLGYENRTGRCTCNRWGVFCGTVAASIVNKAGYKVKIVEKLIIPHDL